MRPILDMRIDPEVFLDYYWLKQELITFCRREGITGTGGKQEITDRIYNYLKTGNIESGKRGKYNSKTNSKPLKLSLTAVIPEGYKNDELHREFFKSVIGSHFKFNVTFMNWMKENSGKTYKDAINQWYLIDKDKKSGVKKTISPQFQYNQYTRDFFKANPGLTREECIRCWKYKKSLPGHNRYEGKDLTIL